MENRKCIRDIKLVDESLNALKISTLLAQV